MTKDELKQSIIKAFGTDNFPEDATLLDENYSYYDNEHVIRDDFARRNWQEVAPLLKERRIENDLLYIFSPEAFKYYIPALMDYTIENYTLADTFIDSFCGLLATALDGKKNWQRYDQGLELSSTQREAVLFYMDYLWEEYWDDEALFIALQGRGLSREEALARAEVIERERKKAKCADEN
jgi:hypothetical protein